MPLISAGNATSTADIEVGVLPEVYLIQPDTSLKCNNDLLASEPTSQVNGTPQTITYKIKPNANWSDGKPINVDDFKYSYNIQKSTDPASGGCAALLSSTGYDLDQRHRRRGQRQDDHRHAEAAVRGLEEPVLRAQQPAVPGARHGQGQRPGELRLHHQGLADRRRSARATSPVARGRSRSRTSTTASRSSSRRRTRTTTATKPKLAPAGHPGVSATTRRPPVQGLKSGELNVIYPQPQLDLVGQVKKLAPNVDQQDQLRSRRSSTWTSTPPTRCCRDVKVRQAFAMALDRQGIVDQTVGQFSSDAKVLNNRLWLNTQPQYKDNAPDQYKKQNIAAAKALLEGDGYTLGGDGIYAKGGKPLSFKIDTTANNPLREQTITVMIPMLKAAGIKATVRRQPGHLQGHGQADQPRGRGLPDRAVRLGRQPVHLLATRRSTRRPKGGAWARTTPAPARRRSTPLLNQWLTRDGRSKIAATGNQIDKLLWDQMATLPLYQKPTFIAYTTT